MMQRQQGRLTALPERSTITAQGIGRHGVPRRKEGQRMGAGSGWDTWGTSKGAVSESLLALQATMKMYHEVYHLRSVVLPEETLHRLIESGGCVYTTYHGQLVAVHVPTAQQSTAYLAFSAAYMETMASLNDAYLLNVGIEALYESYDLRNQEARILARYPAPRSRPR